MTQRAPETGSPPVVLLAPRFSRVTLFVILVLMEPMLVLIAIYPPRRLPQTIIAGLVFAVILVAACRVLRTAYVVTDTELRLRGLLFTRTIPRAEIAGVVSAAVVQRRDRWGSVENVLSYMFRDDRVFGRPERAHVLETLRAWVDADTPADQ